MADLLDLPFDSEPAPAPLGAGADGVPAPPAGADARADGEPGEDWTAAMNAKLHTTANSSI